MSLIFKSSLFFPSFLSSALSLNPIFSQVFIAALAFSYFGKTFAGATMKSSFTQLERRFGIASSTAGFIDGGFEMAVAVLPVVLLGMFLSGFIMKKYKLGILSATKMGYAASFIGFAFTFLYLMLGCDNHPVAGLTNPISLSSACNSNCTCATSQWDPVCGENGLTYMSACFAGCKNITRLKKKTVRMRVFHNCSCIGKADAALKNSSAVLGECRRSDECSKNFIFYTIVKAVSSFMYSLGGVPMYMLLIRSVPQDLKSLAVGFMMLVIRSLGGIPAPVYFGAVIDKTCLKWGSKPCGQKGSCRIYDTIIALGNRAVLLEMVIGTNPFLSLPNRMNSNFAKWLGFQQSRSIIKPNATLK
uniref:Kazal-like domain-containing protein n=1 Tax=Naja naja TaxID=35670 RepID=A0A8C6VQI1_NAJNA